MTERRLKPHVLVLEYIDGTIARYAPPEAFTPPIVAQLYHALERINELGVVHSDLHWGNFIITPSRGVVIDFGEAVLKEKWDESEEEWEECVRCCCEPVAVTALVKGKRVEWSEEFGMPEYKLQPVRTSVT
ncbi:unnamed protein product [Peniophora sp. CBMAI 1063]|nr:unnamed protein product [Peniophora sp. CBMAI 1063]